MIDEIQKLEDKLFAKQDGLKVERPIKKLIKLCETDERERALAVLLRYVREGQLIHWRSFLLADIVGLVKENEEDYQDFFRWCVSQQGLAYWGTDGLLKTCGAAGYPELVALARNMEFSTAERAKAVKELAVHSGQLFDSGLPGDPGTWKEPNLRLDEVLDWQKEGYPAGEGYVPPKVHPALINPRSDLEKAAARLEKKLVRYRRKEKTDPANPRNLLVISDPKDIQSITQRWDLPEDYINFLTNFSPLCVNFPKKGYFNFHLYGAEELIKRQEGYSYNPVAQIICEEWPKEYVVIADVDADPFCIDTSESGSGAIYHAYHGVGEWDFDVYADNFIDFLSGL